MARHLAGKPNSYCVTEESVRKPSAIMAAVSVLFAWIMILTWLVGVASPPADSKYGQAIFDSVVAESRARQPATPVEPVEPAVDPPLSSLERRQEQDRRYNPRTRISRPQSPGVSTSSGMSTETRRLVFLTLVRCQDNGYGNAHDVACMRTAERAYSITRSQLNRIIDEGIRNRWPPLR